MIRERACGLFSCDETKVGYNQIQANLFTSTEHEEEMMERKELLERLRAQIHTDGYDVSVGEWMALYKQNELDLHPEFQKFNCWSNAQKTRFIETLLLAIPQAPILIMQRPDGVWVARKEMERR